MAATQKTHVAQEFDSCRIKHGEILRQTTPSSVR